MTPKKNPKKKIQKKKKKSPRKTPTRRKTSSRSTGAPARASAPPPPPPPAPPLAPIPGPPAAPAPVLKEHVAGEEARKESPSSPSQPVGTAGEDASSAERETSLGEARALAQFLEERFRRECPDWKGGVEDPVTVLLELWAELVGDLRSELGKLQERLLLNFLDAIEMEPRGPFPAYGAVRFLPREGFPPGAHKVPAGTAVTSPRSPGTRKVVFETLEDCWVSGRPVARTYAMAKGPMAQTGFRVLSTESAPVESREAVYPFGSQRNPGRFLFVGDSRLEALRQDPGPVYFEWPAPFSPELSDAPWEYKSSSGWRRGNVSFEVVSSPDQEPVFRMRLSGPLPDLVPETLEGVCLPWIRAHLPVKKEVRVSIPNLRLPGEEKGSPAARFFGESKGILEDLSFSPLPVLLSGRPDGLDPCLFFGFERPDPASLYLEMGSDGPLHRWNPGPPRLEWEFWSSSGWTSLSPPLVRDRTEGLQKSGSIHLEPPPDSWSPSDLFGERFHWVRARWSAGAFVRSPAIRKVYSHAVEVLQGKTIRNVPVGVGLRERNRRLELPEVPDGPAGLFDRLLVERRGKTEVWERVDSLDGAGPRDRWFRLKRNLDGRLLIRFPESGGVSRGPSRGATIRVESLRTGMGSHGNLPPGSLVLTEPPLPFIQAVEQMGPTRGGEDLETTRELRRRAAAAWQAGERAVTEADFRRLVRAVLPDVRRVDVGPDPLCPAGILVVVLPGAAQGGSLGEAARQALDRFLSEKASPGTRVRVLEGAVEGGGECPQVRGRPEKRAQFGGLGQISLNESGTGTGKRPRNIF